MSNSLLCRAQEVATLFPSHSEDEENIAAEKVGGRHAAHFAAIAAVAIGLVGFGSLGAVHLVRSSHAMAPITETVHSAQLWEYLRGTCNVSETWCPKSEDGKSLIEYRDCDGDGILDPYCADNEILKMGYLSSKNGCNDTWPNGFCNKPTVPEKERNQAAGNEITIIHFNDVYQVSGVLDKGVRRGGMSRAAYVIDQERKRNPDRTFVLFAGDLLSPSALSGLFDGAHMVDILNLMKLDAASMGNHEFDMGVDILKKRLKESEFPWLNINILDESGELFAGTQKRLIRDVPFIPTWSKTTSKSRVCIFGSSYDVRQTIFKDTDRIGYNDVIVASSEEVRHLREKEDCDVVLALTHQFSSADCKLSELLGDKIDLILGGHDHSTEMTTVCGDAIYVKADSDLKTQWVMSLFLDKDGKVESVDGRLLTLTDVDPFNETVHDKVVHWEEEGQKEMGNVMGCSAVDLDARAKSVRQEETAIANWFTDSVRAVHRTDVSIFNGGGIRGNRVYTKGNLTKGLVTAMHPFGNNIAKIYVTGKQLRAFIEQGLGGYEQQDGAFPAMAGLNFSFSPTAEKGQRLKKLFYPNGTDVGDKDNMTASISDFLLSTSFLRGSQLYEMTTLNDAVPLVDMLFAAVKQAAEKCIEPKVDGRCIKLD